MNNIGKSIIIATLILSSFFVIGIIIKLPPKPLPTVQEIEATAKAELEQQEAKHQRDMEYAKVRLEIEKTKASRPATAEEIDAQSISVTEHIGLKLLGF